MKYDENLINDYINGNDMDDDILEQLEDNTDFMIEVIKKSNDKKMYFFCSENVKKDFRFVEFFIKKFKDDINLINKVADTFINSRKKQNNSFDFEKDTIIVLMNNLTKKSDDTEFMLYKIESTLFVTEFFLFLETEKLSNNSFEGLGFNIAESLLEGYDILTNYVAETFINDIFYKNKDLEELIHNNVTNKEHLNKDNIDTFLALFIEQFDSALNEYISYDQELLNDLKKDLSKIYQRWDYMTIVYNSKKVEMFRDALSHYFKYNTGDEPSFTYSELEACIVKNMKLEHIFNNADKFEEHIFNCTIDRVNTDNASLLESEFDYNNETDCKFIKFAIETAKKIFFQNEKVEYDPYIEQNKQKKKQFFFMICIDDDKNS